MGDLKEMLNSEDKQRRQARGVLARLFRQILLDVKMTPLMWNNLMIKYLNDPENGIANTGRERSSARGNLNKELHRPNMTWKVFLKGIRFLRPMKVRFEVHHTMPSGRTSVHGVNVGMENQGGADHEE